MSAVNVVELRKILFKKCILQKIRAYHAASASELVKLPAHIFSVAEKALRLMLNNMCLTNQSIIISGESGAGKVLVSL